MKPPPDSVDNDNINIRFTNVGKNKITVMIVKENGYGDIEYIDDMAYNPEIEGRYVTFQLHKL